MRKIVEKTPAVQDEIKDDESRKAVSQDDRMNLAKGIMDQYDGALKELAKR